MRFPDLLEKTNKVRSKGRSISNLQSAAGSVVSSRVIRFPPFPLCTLRIAAAAKFDAPMATNTKWSSLSCSAMFAHSIRRFTPGSICAGRSSHRKLLFTSGTSCSSAGQSELSRFQNLCSTFSALQRCNSCFQSLVSTPGHTFCTGNDTASPRPNKIKTDGSIRCYLPNCNI
jgi:hypothetical protein